MLGFEGLYEKNWKTVKKKIKIFHFLIIILYLGFKKRT